MGQTYSKLSFLECKEWLFDSLWGSFVFIEIMHNHYTCDSIFICKWRTCSMHSVVFHFHIFSHVNLKINGWFSVFCKISKINDELRYDIWPPSRFCPSQEDEWFGLYKWGPQKSRMVVLRSGDFRKYLKILDESTDEIWPHGCFWPSKEDGRFGSWFGCPQ